MVPLLEAMPELSGVDNLSELCAAALEIFGNNQDLAFECVGRVDCCLP